LDSASDDLLFIQSQALSAGVDKKIRRHWRRKSKISPEFEKKRATLLLIRTGPGTGALTRTENRIDGYTK